LGGRGERGRSNTVWCVYVCVLSGGIGVEKKQKA